MAQLLTFFGESYRTSGRMGMPPIHDAVAVASVIDPSLVTTRDARVEIETAGRLTRGMTIVDFGVSEPAHHVGVDLDVERFWDLVLAAVSALELNVVGPIELRNESDHAVVVEPWGRGARQRPSASGPVSARAVSGPVSARATRTRPPPGRRAGRCRWRADD